MSGKLFNFLCSQLERKNSRRTIDLSVNLIFRRIHVYQNGHVPIYRFPSVFFIFFSQKEFFMLTNGTTYQTATDLTGLSALNFMLCAISFFQPNRKLRYRSLQKLQEYTCHAFFHLPQVYKQP